MISRIPALEFLRQICGLHEDSTNAVKLRVWACGYGVAIDLTVKGKSILCAVAGAFRQEVECFAQIGLPNVIRLVGDKTSENQLKLIGMEPPIEFHISREQSSLQVVILYEGQVKATYVLSAV